ncbi:MAG: fructosamine kinase family protein, partial [Burkholderiales bacterium]
MTLPFASATLVALNRRLHEAGLHDFRVRHVADVKVRHGTRTLIVSDGKRRVFVKVVPVAQRMALQAEADGLAALRSVGVRAPEPVGSGASDTEAFLALEHLTLRSARDGDFVGLAMMLAELHEAHADQFGFGASNYIGPTPQMNPQTTSWVTFWRTARLAPQLALAVTNGYSGVLQALGERILDRLPDIFSGHQPRPSLVHGDLWTGNAGFTANGAPVLFDPAVYYGDRETDVAMTELFGGFPP